MYPSKTLVMPILVNYRALVYAVYLVTNCSETGDEQQKCVDVIVVRCSLEDLRFPGTFNGGLTSPDTNLARVFFFCLQLLQPIENHGHRIRALVVELDQEKADNRINACKVRNI